MSLPAPKRLPWLLGLSTLIFILDRVSKNWVSAHVVMGGAIPVIPRVLRISHWTNDGAAFSLFASSASPQTVRWVLVAFSLMASTGVLVLLVRMGSQITSFTVALALILAGALGNVYDRIVSGSVVDFIEVHINFQHWTYHWPDFNVADSAVVTGACLVLLGSLLQKNPPLGGE